MTQPSDELLKRAYAQDASIYQETPDAVAFPKSADDVLDLVRSGADSSLAPQGLPSLVKS